MIFVPLRIGAEPLPAYQIESDGSPGLRLDRFDPLDKFRSQRAGADAMRALLVQDCHPREIDEADLHGPFAIPSVRLLLEKHDGSAPCEPVPTTITDLAAASASLGVSAILTTASFDLGPSDFPSRGRTNGPDRMAGLV